MLHLGIGLLCRTDEENECASFERLLFITKEGQTTMGENGVRVAYDLIFGLQPLTHITSVLKPLSIGPFHISVSPLSSFLVYS